MSGVGILGTGERVDFVSVRSASAGLRIWIQIQWISVTDLCVDTMDTYFPTRMITRSQLSQSQPGPCIYNASRRVGHLLTHRDTILDSLQAFVSGFCARWPGPPRGQAGECRVSWYKTRPTGLLSAGPRPEFGLPCAAGTAAARSASQGYHKAEKLVHEKVVAAEFQLEELWVGRELEIVSDRPPPI